MQNCHCIILLTTYDLQSFFGTLKKFTKEQ